MRDWLGAGHSQSCIDAVYGVGSTQCMLYSVYTVLGVCYTRCMLYFMYTVLVLTIVRGIGEIDSDDLTSSS
jgi:hypothetical protein